MTREYWISQILGKLYAVRYSNGNESITVYEGTYDECHKYIQTCN